MLVYGTGNTLRMLCPGTTASLGRFSVGVESTGASIRVPHSVVLQHKVGPAPCVRVVWRWWGVLGWATVGMQGG